MQVKHKYTVFVYLSYLPFRIVQPELTITRDTASPDLAEGDGLELVCSASDHYPRTSITWLKGATTLSQTSRIDIAERSMSLDNGLYQTWSNLTIASTLTSDSGAYYCKAILQVDGLAQSVAVRVDRDINIMVQGKTATVKCAVC